MGVSNQLNNADHNFEVISSFPELKGKPVVIGEFDPEGSAATPASERPANGYRNTTMFSSYQAEVFTRARELAEKRGINLEGLLTWSFEMENKPYFIGYRVLSSNGIDLPVMNVYRMFAKMGGAQLPVQSSADLGLAAVQARGVRGSDADVYGLASLEPGKLSLMLWNYHDDDVPGPTAQVALTLSGLPLRTGDARITHYRIGEEESNAYTLWKQMGSPKEPSPDQYAKLQQAGQLATLKEPSTVHVDNSTAKLQVDLPRHAVSLLVLEWK
jgi:xylan 1,4-beta-xylosidase